MESKTLSTVKQLQMTLNTQASAALSRRRFLGDIRFCFHFENWWFATRKD